MKYSLAIFDLDGTVLDTLADLTDSVNHILRLHSMPTRSQEEVRSFVGNGIKNLIRRSAPPDTTDELIGLMFDEYTPYYREHCADKTKPYEGICDEIRLLRRNGIKTAVVSNKADYAVKKLTEVFFPGCFDVICGEKDGVRRKPFPDSVEYVIRELGAEKADTVYIGDSEVDILTAQNSGIDCISVVWGFRDRNQLIESGASVIAECTADLPSLII